MPKRSVPYQVIFLAFAVTLAAAFYLALQIHARFARHRPVAVLHLPQEVTFATRLDVEQTVGFERFERVVLPLLERARPTAEPRAKHLERKTTIELAVDTREIVYAEVAGGHWLLLAGGLFRRDEDVLSGVLRMAQEQGLGARLEDQMVVLDRGPAFALADDGTLILASDSSLAKQARFADGQSSFKTLLLKPAAVLTWLSRPDGAAPQTGLDATPAAYSRFWATVEAGARFPTYVEVVGPESPDLPELRAAVSAEWSLERLEFQRQPGAPAGVAAGTVELTARQLDQVMLAWTARMGERMSRSFGPNPGVGAHAPSPPL